MITYFSEHDLRGEATLIKAYRHPLQELCVDIFIPNDISLVGGKGFHNRDQKQFSSLYGSHCTKRGETLNQTQMSTNSIMTKDDGMNSVAVVTGANFSGKSVYLKQTALIVYLAHIGRYMYETHAILQSNNHWSM